MSKQKWINIIFGCLFIIGFLTNLVLISINGTGLTIHETLIFLQEISFFDDAVSQYYLYVLLWSPIVILVYLGLLKIKNTLSEDFYFPAYYHVIHLIVFVSVFVISYTEGRITEFPSPYKTGYLLHYGIRLSPEFYSNREEPYISPAENSIADHIIFIVDESIRGDFLSINNYKINTTPWLKSKSDSVANFGIFPSVTNYSSASNLVIQTGLKPSDLPDIEFKGLKSPNIFSYMQNAGFNSYLIDNQVFDSYNNFLTKFDIEKLDGYYALKEIYGSYADWQLDTAAVNLIRNKISSADKSFTYLIKSGCHFPYRINTSPDVSLNEFENKNNLTDKEEYLTAMKWSVDEFLKKLWIDISSSEKNILVIYTADHAQSMKEDGDIVTGHSTVINPPVSQVKIPLIMFSNNNNLTDSLKSIMIEINKSSFSYFSTLLKFGGYKKNDINKYYSSHIFENIGDSLKFFSGDLFNRGGTFNWNKFNNK